MAPQTQEFQRKVAKAAVRKALALMGDVIILGESEIEKMARDLVARIGAKAREFDATKEDESEGKQTELPQGRKGEAAK